MSEDLRRVSHMAACAETILSYLKGRRRQWSRDQMMRDATLRQFEVMGEAATKVSTAFRDAHPEVPWKRIIAFRNVLIHASDPIDMEQVTVAIDALPGVLKALKKLS